MITPGVVHGNPQPPAVPSAKLQFARGIWRLAAANVTAGNAVRLLHDGPEAFDAMIEIIDGAQSEVALESYIVSDDAVGERFADSLMAAAQRGVRVRLLTDWIGSRSPSRRFWRHLRDSGVEVEIFNPPGFRRWLGLIPRDHRKQLVVDGRIGITGGFGIAEEWDPGRSRSGAARRWRALLGAVAVEVGALVVDALGSPAAVVAALATVGERHTSLVPDRLMATLIWHTHLMWGATFTPHWT